MTENAQIYYLEIVTSEVDKVCLSYSKSLGLAFGEPIAELGNAKTAALSQDSTIGVRAPMHDAEQACTRPYYLVTDISQAVEQASNAGAEVALPPMDIPGRGQCAIIAFGSVQSGFWQV